MIKVLILGGSFAGLEAAATVRRLLGDTAHVTVIDRTRWFEYRPSLPWVVFGRRRPGDVTVPRDKLLSRLGVNFVHDQVEEIDPLQQEVRTRNGRHRYDFLVIALGATSPVAMPPALAGQGLAPVWLPEAMRLREELRRFRGGPVVVAFHPGSPLTCAAYELVFQLDDFLRRRGLRGRSPVALVSYEKRPYDVGGAKASRIVADWLAQCNITLFPGTFAEKVSGRFLKLSDGSSVHCRLLIVVPPYRGSRVLQAVPGLTDANGFVVTDRTMRSLAYPNIYAAGDCVAFPGPKTGAMAEWQGRTAAQNIAADLGVGKRAVFSSMLTCLVDLGPGRGLLTLRRPLPRQGPARMHSVLAGLVPWLGKRAFEKYFLHVRLKKPLFPASLASFLPLSAAVFCLAFGS